MPDNQIDFDYAYNYCKDVSLNHYENFPVGSFLIPKDKRKYVYSIYAFARYADDIADSEKYSEEEKLKRLYALEEELSKAERQDLENLNPDTKQIFIALSNTIELLRVPVDEFRNLLCAFKQDVVKQRFESFNELLEYSKYSANPIGHLVLYVFGYEKKSDNKVFEYSDKICTALQLTNFWQDVSLDLKINRVYLPDKLMNEFNYNVDMLFQKIENDDFRKLIKHLIGKTKKLFDDGSNIINNVKGRLKFELKATINGGEEILKKIEQINYNVLSKRVSLDNLDKIKILGKIFI